MAKATPPRNWTPEELRNKTAEKWQGIFYGGGLLTGAISWASFANHAASKGVVFALVALIAFGLGSLIKTLWVKHGQVDVYVRDKVREAFRMKLYGAGVICGVIAVLALANGGHEAGGFFAVVASSGLLIGGLIPIKWIKRAEIADYR